MTPFLAIVLVWCVIFGFATSAVAQSRGQRGLLGWWLLGALLGIIGLIIAACVQRPQLPPEPPGWYADPWQPQQWRWWDGYQWTWQTAAAHDAETLA